MAPAPAMLAPRVTSAPCYGLGEIEQADQFIRQTADLSDAKAMVARPALLSGGAKRGKPSHCFHRRPTSMLQAVVP
jgi:hypothetical protein